MIMEETKRIKAYGQMIKTNITIVEHNSAIFSSNYKNIFNYDKRV